MKKVRFFHSIQFKFVMIYVLLILIAMQIIGIYFVKELETSLKSNFEDSLSKRISLLVYNIEQEMSRDPKEYADGKTPAGEITTIIRDFVTDEILEVRVIDKNKNVIATSDINQDIVGKKTSEEMVLRALVGLNYDNYFIDKDSGQRVRVMTLPINENNFSDKPIGAIYIVASMEEVFAQMQIINKIFATGTILSMVITAALGIFIARTITRPMSDMRKQAIELANGNFSRKVKVYGEDEIGQLAVTFNYLTDKLDEAQATTEGERRKLASVIAHMIEGVIATNRYGQVILINNPALEMLDVSRETLTNISITKLLNIEDTHTFESILDEQESLILDSGTEERPVILRVSFSVIQKESGLIDGVIAVLYDITEQEKIEQERREFVANVSHELRTPLTTMRSYLEALADGAWKDDEIAPQFLNVTQTETERMIRLVNDLLQLSKLDRTEYRINKDFVNFTVFFDKIIDRFEMTKSQHVSFVRNIPKEALFVEIDTDKITQVLDNIISNALKYSPEGGKVTFTIDKLSSDIQIRIKDEGVGIPKESVNKIFDRFYRVDKARTRKLGGTGLGLAIAKEMILAHGGDIWAQSVEGQGTTVFFTIPYNPEQEDEWE
ncbi:cell wall metabolism sensor histidine kinase WalK [Metabacillus sediminilitoris]|uniref:histidine kinase n=1 Tax=Metabacillus sediminilitoris TaxID=2567941 RepID=A0A4S4BSF1_9BACI|nr:cell wall metabolism sensor histidine kinase WalK [Metabacillus sediminilitoris]QGQ48538.1 cell wall metabolism sensor histidine kinase WalK [Metabacillus sediminilitoris]THF77924.1 cell wall metabolism sensor histidine kinase WalK [Metabacillus sediminilitoris]